MKIKRAYIQNYRSIVDSGIVDLEDQVTVLIGKNEQGKSNFLRALESFNPKKTYSPKDLPSHLRPVLDQKESARIPVVTIWFIPDISERVELKGAVPDIESIKEFRITRYHDGHYEYKSLHTTNMESDVEFSSIDADQLISQLRVLAEELRSKLKSHSERLPSFLDGFNKANTTIDQFTKADFSNYGQISNLIKTFGTSLKGIPGQDQGIKEDIENFTKKFQIKNDEILEFLGKDPKREFENRIPFFLFHSMKLDRIPNEVKIQDFTADPDKTSKGMANLWSGRFIHSKNNRVI